MAPANSGATGYPAAGVVLTAVGAAAVAVAVGGRPGVAGTVGTGVSVAARVGVGVADSVGVPTAAVGDGGGNVAEGEMMGVAVAEATTAPVTVTVAAAGLADVLPDKVGGTLVAVADGPGRSLTEPEQPAAASSAARAASSHRWRDHPTTWPTFRLCGSDPSILAVTGPFGHPAFTLINPSSPVSSRLCRSRLLVRSLVESIG